MKVFLSTISIIILCGCSSSGERYVVIFDHGHGLKNDMPIMMNDKIVGKVESINLCNEFKACVSIKVHDKLEIPKDSKFRSSLVKFDLTVIKIEPGNSKNYLKHKDTVVGLLHY